MAQNGLNKINYERFTEEEKRGFDILSNTKINDSKDKNSKKTFAPRVLKPKKLWSKIQHGSSKGFIPETQQVKSQTLDTGLNTNTEFWNSAERIERRSRRLMKGSKLGSSLGSAYRRPSPSLDTPHPINISHPMERPSP